MNKSNKKSESPLTYNGYLQVEQLIGLQQCLSEPVHHDEHLFITVHQVYELWFKQILHELDAVLILLGDDRAMAAIMAMERVVEIEKLLIKQVHILESMTPMSFLAFRDELRPASGFQSMQFREIEFSSGLKDLLILESFRDDRFAYPRLEARFNGRSVSDEFYNFLARRGFDVPVSTCETSKAESAAAYSKRARAALEVLSHFEGLPEEFRLMECLISHDEQFMLWRDHHVRMVERMVGNKTGTGGSEGVGYLKTTLDRKFFPELWEARTLLSARHTDTGCPFSRGSAR